MNGGYEIAAALITIFLVILVLASGAVNNAINEGSEQCTTCYCCEYPVEEE